MELNSSSAIKLCQMKYYSVCGMCARGGGRALLSNLCGAKQKIFSEMRTSLVYGVQGVA